MCHNDLLGKVVNEPRYMNENEGGNGNLLFFLPLTHSNDLRVSYFKINRHPKSTRTYRCCRVGAGGGRGSGSDFVNGNEQIHSSWLLRISHYVVRTMNEIWMSKNIDSIDYKKLSETIEKFWYTLQEVGKIF